MYIIYKHTLLIGEHCGWSYIGLTKQVAKRRWKHGQGYLTQPVFGAAIKKYGWDNFSHEVIEANIKTLEEANKREQFWISVYHTYVHDPFCRGYNTTTGGDGQPGRVASIETKEKIRQKMLGRKNGPHSKDWKQHISEGHSIPIICLETNVIYPSTKIAAEETGILRSAIANCLSGRSKTAGKFHWKYVKNSFK